MQIKLLILLLSMTSAFHASAQQAPNSTQFWNTLLNNNPAVAGLQYQHAANVLYHNQWDAVNGAPTTLFFNYAAKVKALHGGVGISYMYENYGMNGRNELLGNYAYHLPVGTGELSFGAAAGVSLSSYTFWPSADNPNFSTHNYLDFTANAGIAWHAPKWNAGISASQLGVEQNPNLWAFADYTFDLNEDFRLRPQLQVLTDGIQSTHNASIMLLVEHAWAGINFSYDNYVGIMAGYDIRGKFRIGYGYDYTTNQLSSVSRGTHEIVLSYLIK